MKKINKKNLTIIISILLIVIVGIIYFITKNNVSNLEKIKILEVSDNVINYSQELDVNKDSLDKLIIYSLNYSYSENSKNELFLSDVENIISNTFNKKVTALDLDKFGVSDDMVNDKIVYDPNSGKYKINITNNTMREIANTKISFFKNNNVYKRGKKYFVEYIRYSIDNPYEVLNYYTDLQDDTDITVIKKYLEGKESLKNFKSYINDDILNNRAKENGKMIIELSINNNKLLVDKIYSK